MLIIEAGRMAVRLTSAMSSVEVTVWKPCVCQVVSQPEGAIRSVLSGSPEFAGEGPLELIFAVTAPSGDDLLIGTLQLPGTVPDQQLSRSVRERIEVGEDRVTDLHLWRLGPGHVGLIVSLVSDTPQPPDVYKQRLTGIEGLSHVTVEVHACPNHPQREAA